MKIIFSLLLIFTLCGFIFAQSPTNKPFDVSDKENRIFWKNNNSSCCDLIYVEGIGYRIIKHNGVNIAFTPMVYGEYYIMNIVVRNESGERFNVRPEDSSLSTWKKKDDSLKLTPTPITPTDANQIANRMRNNQNWANALSGISAALATQQSTVTNNQTGVTATIKSPNTQAQANAQNQARQNSARVDNLANTIVNDAFKANTLFVGDTTSGNIYFKVKKHERGVFIIKINGMEYAFMYTFAS